MVIVNLSNLCWTSGKPRRNQSIFTSLIDTGRFKEGFFLQPPMMRTARAFQFLRQPEVETVLQKGKNTVLQPFLTLPAGYPEAAARKAVLDLGQKLVKDLVRGRPYLLWINSISHFQAQLAEQMMRAAATRVFDSAEMLMMYQRNGSERAQQAKAILDACDIAVCGCERAMAHIQHPVKRMLADDAEELIHYPHAKLLDLPPLFPKPAGMVYVGFLGTLTEERIDDDLLHAIFLRFPDYQFIFVGSTNRASMLSRMKNYPNFHHILKVPEEFIGSVIQQFDVAIVPELNNDHTRCADGTRIFEYLACGTPVLSSTLRDQRQFGDAIQVATSVWEFSYQLERMVKSRGTDNGPAAPIALEYQPKPGIAPLMEVLFSKNVAY